MYFQKQLRDWFRVVLPNEGVVIGFVVMYLMTDVFQIFGGLMHLRLGGNVIPRENEPGAGLAVIAALIYGGYRVAYFHPLYRKDYREWLQATPWGLGRRLPLGPVHVVWQDLLVLGVLTLATLRMSPPLLWPVPLAFLLAYVAASIFPLLFTGESVLAFVAALLLGAAGRWSREPLAVAGLLAGVYGLCFLGLRRSLGRIHEWDLSWWNDQGLSEVFSKNMGNLADVSRKKILGWPHDRLSLKKNETPVRFVTGLCISVLVGWWLHAFLYHVAAQGQGAPHPMGLSAMLLIPCLIMAGIRVWIYVWGYASPLGCMGRLMTFRWIIPGYDKVFIPPVCTLALSLYGPTAAAQMGVPWEYGIPTVLGLMVLVALTMPPGLDEWRLTGHHRIVPGMQAQQNELMEA